MTNEPKGNFVVAASLNDDGSVVRMQRATLHKRYLTLSTGLR
jgi:hypothetical protein